MNKLYCPDCETTRRVASFKDGPHACDECGAMLLERPEWPRRPQVTDRLRQTAVYAVAAAFVLGPPAWVILVFSIALLNGAPVVTIGTASVTRTTEIGGALGQVYNSAAGAVFPIWALLMMLFASMPIMPRRI